LINTFLFNLEIEKHFKISDDLRVFYSKLISEKNEIKELKVNYLHLILFEIYSEILTDIFTFTIFMKAFKLNIETKNDLKNAINIDSEKVDLNSLLKISFIFKKIKKFLNKRENNFHGNLEKIVIMIIEEMDIAYLNNFPKKSKIEKEKEINEENIKEEYKKYLEFKDYILFEVTEVLNKIYFEAFEFVNSNLNVNCLNKIENLRIILKDVDEAYFYGLFENKTKKNFLDLLNQIEFFFNIINNNYNEEINKKFSKGFLNIVNIIPKKFQNNSETNFKSEIKEQNENNLINSDFLILNYMRINVLEDGKFIINLNK